jgi:hypothetical protein
VPVGAPCRHHRDLDLFDQCEKLLQFRLHVHLARFLFIIRTASRRGGEVLFIPGKIAGATLTSVQTISSS